MQFSQLLARLVPDLRVFSVSCAPAGAFDVVQPPPPTDSEADTICDDEKVTYESDEEPSSAMLPWEHGFFDAFGHSLPLPDDLKHDPVAITALGSDFLETLQLGEDTSDTGENRQAHASGSTSQSAADSQRYEAALVGLGLLPSDSPEEDYGFARFYPDQLEYPMWTGVPSPRVELDAPLASASIWADTNFLSHVDLHGLRHLRTLHLSNLTADGARSFAQCIDAFDSLRSLVLEFRFVDDAILQAVAQHCGPRGLASLSLIGCGTKITDKGMLAIIHGCTSLEVLSLRDVQARFSRKLWSKVDWKLVSLKWRTLRMAVSAGRRHHS